MSIVTTIERQRVSVHPSIRAQRGRKRRDLADQIIGDLHTKGHVPFRFRLEVRHALPFGRFLRDFHAGWGVSGALKPVSLLGSFGAGTRGYGQPGIPSDAGIRASVVLNSLQRHELELLRWLEEARDRATVTLAVLGQEWCGAVDERDAAQRATGALQSLARSVAEHYPMTDALVVHGRNRRLRAPAEP